MSRILVVDDDAGFRASLVETLESLGYEAIEAGDGAGALARLAHGDIDAVVLDHRLGSETGTEVLRAAKEALGERLPPVLVLTAYADARSTIEAIGLGAFDYLSKPVGRAQIRALLEKALATAGRTGAAGTPAGDQLVGESPAMHDVHKLIGRAAASDSTVLITGETGTGKEIVSRTLHEFSARSAGPFVAVNCAAIPAELLESELFGHSKGAFSGAVNARAGCFEQANHGTLLLDEIGDMPLPMQAKILRVLEESRVTRLGESAERVLDVRIVAASHRDLQAMVRWGEFRADLFFRLNVLRIELPPLRARPEDIEPLALLFLNRGRGESKVLSPSALALLEAESWPGNVRQLCNAMERVRAMVPGARVDADDLAFLAQADTKPAANAGARREGQAPMSTAIASLERDLVAAALEQAGGNRSEAARSLGISRAQLYRKLRALGLDDR